MTSETQQSWEQFISLSTRIALFLRRTAPWLTQPIAASATGGAKAATAGSADAAERREEDASCVEHGRSSLPWWAMHHPAVSFRGPAEDDRRD